MGLLFINACYREDSRTKRLADQFLSKYEGNVEEIAIGDLEDCSLKRDRLKLYNESVAAHDFKDEMFRFAKQFADAEEILIATPFWNYSIPAALHSYLEIVCTQGITFDLIEGKYTSLCKAKRLIYITTAGGYIPENDHGFGYVKTLATEFWNIENIEYYKADGIDIWGVDVEAELNKVFDCR